MLRKIGKGEQAQFIPPNDLFKEGYILCFQINQFFRMACLSEVEDLTKPVVAQCLHNVVIMFIQCDAVNKKNIFAILRVCRHSPSLDFTI